MRYVRYVLIFILVFYLFGVHGTDVSAATTGLVMTPYPQERADNFLRNVQLAVLYIEPKRRAIDCFDVSDDGLVALGCSDSRNKTVCIYTRDGVFQYGYSFFSSGSYAVEFEQDHLNIYFVRSDLAVSVMPSGEVLAVREIVMNTESSQYWDDVVSSKKRQVGDTKYELCSDLGPFGIFSADTQLVIREADGEEHIWYDVNKTHLVKMIHVTSAASAFVTLVVVSLSVQNKKKWRERREIHAPR